jgi:hypothetical protein
MIIHDWHVFWCGGVAQFVLSPPVVAPAAYEVVCGLCDVMKMLTTAHVNVNDLNDFFVRMVETLCHFEKTFPQTEHAIVFHLLVEIYEYVKDLGPSYTMWMYVFERYIGTLTRKIHMRQKPEMNLLAVHGIDMALDRVFAAHGDRMLAGLPKWFLDRTKVASLFSAPVGESLVSFPNPTRHYLTEVNLSDFQMAQLLTTLNRFLPTITMQHLR